MTFCDAEGWAVFSQRRAMDFTMCFQDSVLTLIPSVVLLVALSPRIFTLAGKGRLEGVKASPVFYLKMLAIVAAMGVQAAIIAQIVSLDTYATSGVLSAALYLIALLGAALLHYFEFFNMVNPSAGLMVFWLFTAMISIFPTRTWTQESPTGLSGGGEPHSIPVLKLVFSILSSLMFVLENIPKPNRRSLRRKETPLVVLDENIVQSNPSPEPYANFFTRITFFWLLPLLNLGKKKSLKMEDIYSVHPKLLSYPLYLTSKAKMDADDAITLQKIKEELEAEAQALKDGVTQEALEKAKKTQKGKIRLVSTVLHSVGYGFMSACIPRVLYIAALYIRPVLFSNLIAFVNSYQGPDPQEAWIGFGLLIAVFCSAQLSSLFDGQFQNICYNSSLKARGVFVSLIYRKALKLSSTNKQEGMGSIVNHMSADVDKVVAFFNILHLSWSSIVEVIVTMALLWSQVRYALFASVGVIVVIMAISGVCYPQVGKYQKSMMKASDHRMKLIAELVNYIKSIKLYAWEPYFLKKIVDIRVLQLDQLRLFYSWITVLSTFLNSVGPFCTFATLAVYTAIANSEGTLNIQRIFTTITLINMLEDPVSMINQSLSAIVSGTVAYRRLSVFLNSEEIDADNVERNMDVESSEFAYVIENGTFGWYTPEAIQSALDKKEKEDQAKAKADAAAAKKNKKTNSTKKDETAFEDIRGEKSEIESSISTTLNLQEEKTDSEVTTTTEETRDSMGPVLHDIQLKIRRGAMTAVVGRVGEGKSSLVGALLGEMHRYSGTVHAYGSVAYVAQSAWILNDTVRNNILFGKEYDRERYLKTIRACALIPDLKMLVDSDRTVIGEKGINLSGGQKQRISIARAVYADADVYIFDDPLSAVDAHVDHHIFEQAMCTILANKSRILVTNGVSHLQDVDQIVVIKAGKISQNGVYDDLIQDIDGDLFRLIQESKVATSKEKSEDEEKDSDSDSLVTSDDESTENEASGSDEKQVGSSEVTSGKSAERPVFKRSKSSKVKVKEDDLVIEDSDEVNQEIEAEGRVGWSVYKFYLSTVGITGVISFLIVCILFLGVNIATLIWLQLWGKDNERVNFDLSPKHSTNWWIMSYFWWILASAVMLAFAIGFTMVFMARKASKQLHVSMLKALLRSPMSFFDVTSSGKIVNRFSHDVTSIDMDLPLQFLNFLFIAMMALNILILCIMATPYFAIIMLPLGYCYYWLGGFFLVSSRELKRLDSAARSPMYAHFGETLSGLVTIRAFQDADRFAVQATKLLDRSQQTSYLTNATTRWLQIMLDFVSTFVLCIVGLMAVVQRHSVNVGFFSAVLSQIGVLTVIMSRILSTVCLIETSIVSVERIREYSMLTPEARDVIPDSKTPGEWPQNGQVIFSDYSTRYREGLDLVLKNIDLTIPGGSRVGIVGRTGAGKSSVTLALFRIIEAASGSISIDGIDISTLGLTELRSRLTIIPQDPFLFGDSVRTNLDPFGEHTDAEIWAALDSASLKAYVMTLTDGLSAMIENGGENMSLGQRQLMSLARAMLSKNTRVLCLDEATAAIDVETDNAIQRALRREFKSCTVLTIAHRINTIMDSDKILVLDHGRVAEFDTPETLLQNKDSIFFSLASKSGNA
ncbi:hypothetical protein EMPS_05496 [Entomortierella parvispora]|uniref:P-loop containing nucleoside triphosphate hydrolase protein n=1 Tax=Entomortierella parvispora TaxID=205924 RepID=A0A9P3HAX9_9FUNG|nr:hypothetical protein EMPS_05496 [Entomortierella parvispora]